jgi:DNA-binding HxlR family transcriptional regulator
MPLAVASKSSKVRDMGEVGVFGIMVNWFQIKTSFQCRYSSFKMQLHCEGDVEMARVQLNKDHCPVARSVDILGDKWALLIVRNAFDGMSRFGDFLRDLGMARNILSDRLRHLVEAGVLVTVPASDGSAYQEYVLSDKGAKLFPVIVALRQWAESELFVADEPHSVLLDKRSEQPLVAMMPMTQAGTPLSWDEAFVKKVVQTS